MGCRVTKVGVRALLQERPWSRMNHSLPTPSLGTLVSSKLVSFSPIHISSSIWPGGTKSSCSMELSVQNDLESMKTAGVGDWREVGVNQLPEFMHMHIYMCLLSTWSTHVHVYAYTQACALIHNAHTCTHMCTYHVHTYLYIQVLTHVLLHAHMFLHRCMHGDVAHIRSHLILARPSARSWVSCRDGGPV